MGVKIRPPGVSIVAAGVPAGQMVALIRSPLRKSFRYTGAVFVRIRVLLCPRWPAGTPAATNNMFRHVAAFSRLLTPSSRPRYF